jgi:uncharacterized protein
MNKSLILLNVLIVSVIALLIGLGILMGRSLLMPGTIELRTNNDMMTTEIFDKRNMQITVVGSSQLDIQPQIAIINLGIVICNPNGEQANQKVNEGILSLNNGLIAIGIQKEKIVPSGFTFYPDNDRDGHNIGYCAANRIDVITDDLTVVGKIIDKSIASGATNVYGVTFNTKDMEAAKRTGIQLAFADSENQANILAQKMGSHLGKIISTSITISGDHYDMFVGYSGGAGAVEPQNHKLTVSITVVYEVESYY